MSATAIRSTSPTKFGKKKKKEDKPRGYAEAPSAQPWERRTRVSMEVDIADIFLPACQREQMPNADKIEKHFELARLDAPVVNIRSPRLIDTWEALQPQNATMALTDGYQRITALKKLGFSKVRVETIEASVEYEEWYFAHQDKFKAKLNRSNLYGFHLATKDPRWVEIDRIARRNGFYIPNKITSKAPDDVLVKTPTGIEDCYAYDNEGVVLNRALKIIYHCWSGYDNAAQPDVVRGVGRIVRDYGNKITPEIEEMWRTKIQLGALIEAATGQGAQADRAKKVAGKLRKTAKIVKKANGAY